MDIFFQTSSNIRYRTQKLLVYIKLLNTYYHNN